MSNLRDASLTPMLRFVDFQNADAWRTERMRKLYSFMPTNSYSREKLNYEHGDAKNIHYGDIHTRLPSHVDVARERLPFVNYGEALPEASSEIHCREGDIVIADASEDLADVGKSIEIIGLNGERLLAGQHTIHVRRSDDTLIMGFGGFLFRSGWVRSQIRMEAQGTKVYEISPRRLASVEIAYPSDQREQRKIVDCLSSLDAMIAAQSRKVEALKAHKRGLMQRLFPRERETVPRLRFPEFRGAPEWKEIKAGKLFANRADRGDVALPIYSVTVHDGMVRRSSLDRDFGDIEDPAGNRKALKGDIAYNMMRMWQGALGVAVEDCLVSPAYVVLVPEDGVVSQFFAYLFKLPSSLLLLTSHSRGLTKDRLRLYYNDFATITLRCPAPAEQQKIADCLSSTDADIATQFTKLDALKSHKAGLMHQLFPSPDVD